MTNKDTRTVSEEAKEYFGDFNENPDLCRHYEIGKLGGEYWGGVEIIEKNGVTAWTFCNEYETCVEYIPRYLFDALLKFGKETGEITRYHS